MTLNHSQDPWRGGPVEHFGGRITRPMHTLGLPLMPEGAGKPQSWIRNEGDKEDELSKNP